MSRPSYSVQPGAAVTAAPRAEQAESRTAAVLVVHGMGGQLQFQTLTDIADGLREASVRGGGAPSDIVSRAIGVGDERLERMELTVGDGTTTRAVHVYEAYWAPLTEGRVTLRDVIRFLFRAGFDGLWHSAWQLPFKRFLDQRYVTFPVPVRTPLLLLAALLVALSLVIMNLSIVGLAAMRSPLKIAPDWATASLFRDATAILDLFVAAAVVFAAALLPSLAWRKWLTRPAVRDRRRRVRAATGKEPRSTAAGTVLAGLPAIAAFVAPLAATVVAGVAMPLVIYFHTTQARTDESGVSVLDLALSAPAVDAWLRGTAMMLMVLTIVAIGAIAIVFAMRVVRGLGGAALTEGWGKQFWLTLTVALAVAAIVAAGSGAAWLLVPQVPHGDWFDVSGEGGLSIVWLLAIGVSAVARHFLVAYVGDVAAYVQPQQLDRFNTLRIRVRDCVWRSARAVFLSDERYDEVIVVGHSLGSMIGYDVLNRLYLEEELGTVPRVEARSKLFMTFGSPLDKIAFLFAIQGSNREGREALATSTQPLIGFPSRRPRWVNIYSGWDIVSGSLDFYDRPGGPRAVENRSDPEAAVWLAAHTQYWDGQLVFDTLHGHLVS